MPPRFTFYFAQTGRNYAAASDRFVLPGYTVHFDHGRLHVEPTAATRELVTRVAERYRDALQTAGLSLPGMRMDGDPDPMGWAQTGTVNAASQEERAFISRALRTARDALLEPPVSDALRQAYGYLQDAREAIQEASRRAVAAPASVFVDLYKVVETILHEFGGDRAAGVALNAARELAAVKRVCNEGKRDTRHAPRAGAPRSPVSWDEMNSALDNVQTVVIAYERKLGLP